MNILKKPIDYEGLEEELEEALKEDTLYELRNSAKLRAIEQRVPTYEHFRQMVNGAHLKPLEPKDKAEKTKISWNRESRNFGFKNFEEKKGLMGVKNCLKVGEKAKLREMFKIELPVDVLGEFLSVCLENFDGNSEKIVEILQEISECRRFQLTATFMNESDKLTCQKLFCRLVSEGSSVDKLADKFHVNFKE
ncbi:dynein axonemal assembly factor 19 [Cotesia typhae]|uniref:dynein axonemal assembly factor 19 n=1 Tax=Cotesia typhae TaxID=2053667 RepID=UPI003D69D5A1